MVTEEKPFNLKLTIVTVKLLLFALIVGTYSKDTEHYEKDVIYILEWLPSIYHDSIDFLEMGKKSFFNRQCRYQNCFITDNASYFDDPTMYHAIMFNSVNLRNDMILPPKRTESQIYIFFGMEHLGPCPLQASYNNFFNLTWTYKLTSDISMPYITVKNKQNKILGPNTNMKWKKMRQASKSIQRKLQDKSKMAAWIVSHCHSINNRSGYVEELVDELKRYDEIVDIYGACGDYSCLRDAGMNECYAKIENDYYFYLAFENSFHEDYVTEKVLHGLRHFSVPVVYGGADYDRFLPPSAYLNARELGPVKLAEEMIRFKDHKYEYYDFFKWHRYYSFYETAEDAYVNQICGLCATLNDMISNNETKTYPNISRWWNDMDKPSECSDIGIVKTVRINRS